MADPIPLAEEIVKARNLLDQLWEACEEPKERKKIRKQKTALDVEMMRLISINIKKSGEQYDKAIECLEKANGQIEKALKNLDKIAEALEAIATAIDFIAEVKPA